MRSRRGGRCDPRALRRVQELTGTGDIRVIVRTAETTGLSWTFGYNLRPQPLLLIESTALESLDHVVLMLSDEIDPTSIPAPSDFDIRVDGVPVTENGVRLLYQGLRGFPLFADSGFADGVAFLKISWDEADTLSRPITLSYTPGVRPLQDRSGNQTPGFQDLMLERIDPAIDLAFIDDGAGPNHVVFLTAPLDPDLPDASDFTVTLDDGQVLTGTDINLRHPDLGFGLLDITLDASPRVLAARDADLRRGGRSPDAPGRHGGGRLHGRRIRECVRSVSGGTPASENGEPVTVTLHDYLGNGAATLEVTFPSVEEGGVTTFVSLDPADVAPLGANFAATRRLLRDQHDGGLHAASCDLHHVRRKRLRGRRGHRAPPLRGPRMGRAGHHGRYRCEPRVRPGRLLLTLCGGRESFGLRLRGLFQADRQRRCPERRVGGPGDPGEVQPRRRPGNGHLRRRLPGIHPGRLPVGHARHDRDDDIGDGEQPVVRRRGR